VPRTPGIVLLGVFLRVFPLIQQRGMSCEEIYTSVEKSMRKFFGKRGEHVIQDNLRAVKRGNKEVITIPREVIETAA
jgi:pyruvate-ferredoxin/flavodoxin oxidoreductase